MTETPPPIRMTTTTALILDALRVAHEGRYGEFAQVHGLYGARLCDLLGLTTGTVHPVLARLQRSALVVDEWNHDSIHPRRYYRINKAGLAVAGRIPRNQARAPRPRPKRSPSEGDQS